MEISLISDTLTTIASTQVCLSFGFSKFLLNSSPDQSSGSYQISASMFPLDAVATPPVKSNRVRTLPRRLLNKRRRTRRRSLTGGDDSDDSEEIFGFFSDGGDGDGNGDGSFNNSNGGGGSGGSWNFGGFGGSFWEEYDNSYHDPAFDFVYEVLSWIVLSNCLHFAFKKVARIVADGFSDDAREKVPMRLEPVC